MSGSFISNLIPFTKETYLHLLNAFNLDYWPIQIFWIIASIYIIIDPLFKNKSKQLAWLSPALIAFSWLSLCIFYHSYLGQILWAAPWLVVACLLQSALLGLIFYKSKRPDQERSFVYSLILAIVLLLPIEFFIGLDFSHILALGMSPERTALASLLFISRYSLKGINLVAYAIPTSFILVSAFFIYGLSH